MPWTLILLVAMLVYASRALGLVLMAGVEATPRIRRFLDTLAVSVIAAIVATTLIQVGVREIAAASVTVLIMILSRSAVWAMAAGTAIAALWTRMVA